MVDLCRHIKSDGHRCGTPAVHGTLFCYHHGQRRTAVKKARVALNPANPHMPIPFVFPEDRAAIQHNLYLVALALASKRISDRTANAYTGIWRACRVNLGKAPLVETDPDNAVDRVILTPDGDEITTPQQMLEKGEVLNHGPECPCGRCAGKYRNAPPELHHHDCRCGICKRSTDSGRPALDAPSASKAEEQEPAKPDEPSGSIPNLQAVGWNAVAATPDLGASLTRAVHQEPCAPSLTRPLRQGWESLNSVSISAREQVLARRPSRWYIAIKARNSKRSRKCHQQKEPPHPSGSPFRFTEK